MALAGPRRLHRRPHHGTRFRRRAADDRDATSVATADVDDATARRLVDDLIDADVVTPVPEDRVLLHEPSGAAFDLSTQLAVFHRGWTAGRNTDAEAE